MCFDGTPFIGNILNRITNVHCLRTTRILAQHEMAIAEKNRKEKKGISNPSIMMEFIKLQFVEMNEDDLDVSTLMLV